MIHTSASFEITIVPLGSKKKLLKKNTLTIMACKMFCILGLIFFGFSPANARVFYVDGPNGDARNAPRASFAYPLNYPSEGSEQSSRDLDMSFSAGAPNEISENRRLFNPTKKVQAYSIDERPAVWELNREYDRPISYHKLVDTPNRRIIYDDQYPVTKPGVYKVDNDGTSKGDIVMELRITANTHNNDAF